MEKIFSFSLQGETFFEISLVKRSSKISIIVLNIFDLCTFTNLHYANVGSLVINFKIPRDEYTQDALTLLSPA